MDLAVIESKPPSSVVFCAERQELVNRDTRKKKPLDGTILHVPMTDELQCGSVVARHDIGRIFLFLNSNVCSIQVAEQGLPWFTGYEVQISNARRDDAHCGGSSCCFILRGNLLLS